MFESSNMTKKLTRNNYIMGNILMCTVHITVVKLLNWDVLYGWGTKWTWRKWEWGKGLVWQSRSKRPFENIEAQCQNRCRQWTTMLWTWQGYEDYSDAVYCVVHVYQRIGKAFCLLLQNTLVPVYKVTRRCHLFSKHFIPALSVKMKYLTASIPLLLTDIDIDSTAKLQNDGLFFF
jgi:hypothetical protein